VKLSRLLLLYEPNEMPENRLLTLAVYKYNIITKISWERSCNLLFYHLSLNFYIKKIKKQRNYGKQTFMKNMTRPFFIFDVCVCVIKNFNPDFYSCFPCFSLQKSLVWVCIELPFDRITNLKCIQNRLFQIT
jgi:hypothetical protein